VARINLGAWKFRGLPGEWLFNMFLSSAKVNEAGKATLLSYLDVAESCFEGQSLRFDLVGWKAFLDEYKRAEMPALHHSEEYRRYELPSYRIVNSRFVHLLPILDKICKLECRKKAAVIAVDGRAASGKSTLSEMLSAVIGASIIYMDDFFLPPHLRSEERLRQVGGNIHYERFYLEVLPNLRSGKEFSYGVFDCSKMKLEGERQVDGGNYRIVEGSYSHHPFFGDYADLRVFVSVSEDTQADRILMRNGERMAEMFKTRWIPMEEAYFKDCGIEKKADIVIKTD
jgi:uridine kinase